jgi:DNA topoisomerase-1
MALLSVVPVRSFAAGGDTALEPGSCQTVRFADVGWTDVTATTGLASHLLRKLGYQPSRTMRIAQKLYEGVELGDEGAVGLITYMRTDSTRIANDALDAVRGYINTRYGADYVPEKPTVYKSKERDAHGRSVRPASVRSGQVAPYLSRRAQPLHAHSTASSPASWSRRVSSRRPSTSKRRGVLAHRTGGEVRRFIRVYTEGLDEASTEDDERTLPALAEADRLKLLALTPDQHFTQPPPRFSQATLIKELEEKGIGRPSTYASIMNTILGKEYVQEAEQRRLYPTELGMLVTDLLVVSFDILNVEFTAEWATACPP